ncbi:MAG TPA: CZB domain-containing protein [Prosthecobacter sp.]|nr:CZB domain-containing protein [Prosthecobacter sp.]
MKNSISRRTSLKLMTAGTLAGLAGRSEVTAAASPSTDPWGKTHDRVFLGGDFWANPMEDWRVSEGGAECLNMGGGRSVHSLTHQVTKNGAFTMGVTLTRLEVKNSDGGAGFRIGIRSELNEHRSNCFVQKGINAGWQGDQLVLGQKTAALKDGSALKQVRLTLKGAPEGDMCVLTLTASAVDSGAELGAVSHSFKANELLGNVSIANNFIAGAVGAAKKKGKGKAAGTVGAGRYRFQNWTMEGDAFAVTSANQFGPLLWSMYSLSDSRTDEGFVMKISALTGPMGAKDSQVVELHVQKGEAWKSLGTAKLDPDAWVATFRIPKWDEKQATPYKLVYREKHTDGSETPHEWTGTIKANPEGRPLRMAALTCQNDYGFPYAPVAENLLKLDPDLVFFSGDQIYENHGGFGIIREPAEPAILNYLRKFYQHGWAFREVMRNVAEVRGFVERSVEQSDAASVQIEQVRSIVADNTSQMGEIATVLDQQSQAVAEIAQGVTSIADHAKVTAGYADRAIVAVGASETLINEQFADLDRRNIPNYVLHRAKSDHLLWKKRLSEMLVGLNSLKPSELSDHHQCRLGKWYDTVGEQRLREHPAFAALAAPHEAVHRHGRAAAACHARGDHDGAKAELARMEQASEAVVESLDRLLSR